MKRPWKVLVLTHESLVPPETIDGLTEQEIDVFRTEYDVVTFLHNAGHDVRPLGLYDSLVELRRTVREWRPHIVFNLLQEFQGIGAYDQYIVAYLELLKQPYTGCNPRGMMLSRDKVLSKQILAYHRIPTPRFTVFRRGRTLRLPRKLSFPLFVKSAVEDASLGISQASIVEDVDRLRDRVAFIHDHIGTDALVEEYIDGRELYVGVLGNTRLTTLPVWEMRFGTLSAVQAGIATRKVKWDGDYQRRHGIRTGRARHLGEGVEERLSRLSRRIYRALHMTGYARMDFRLTADGTPYLLEANCNPNLSHGEDFAESADSAGLRYPKLLHRIITLGLGYQAEWRTTET